MSFPKWLKWLKEPILLWQAILLVVGAMFAVWVFPVLLTIGIILVADAIILITMKKWWGNVGKPFKLFQKGILRSVVYLIILVATVIGLLIIRQQLDLAWTLATFAVGGFAFVSMAVWYWPGMKDPALHKTFILIWGALLIGALAWWMSEQFGHWFIGVALFVGLFSSFVKQGIKGILNDPPHMGVSTIFGARKRKFRGIKAGNRWFPLYPVWHSAIPVRMVAADIDITPEQVRTPKDNAPLKMPISITGMPNPDYLVNFLDYGREEGVKRILQNITDERVRIWIRSPDEGPDTWEEALNAQEEAVEQIVKAIVGRDGIPRMPSRVPTSVLRKYFATPQRNLTEKEEKAVARLYQQSFPSGSTVDPYERITKLLDSPVGTPGRKGWEKSKDEIELAIEKRNEDFAALRRAKIKFLLEPLGYDILRLNVGAMQLVPGPVADAADKLAKELADRKAETVEIETGRQLLELALLPIPSGIPGRFVQMTLEEAKEFTHIEREKVVKKISEGKGNLSPETRAMIMDLAREFINSRRPALSVPPSSSGTSPAGVP